MSKTRVAGLAISLALFPAAANAACTLADVAGKWQVYVWHNILIGKAAGDWFQCKLVIDRAGNVADTTCSSTSVNNKLTNGKVTLANAAACTYTATYKLKGLPHRIDHATLAKDKNAATGVGLAGNVKMIYHFTRI